MKLVLIFSLACALVVSAFGQATTPNLQMTEPAHGAPNWDTQMNGNFNILDNIYSVGACGDSTHALAWSPSLKKLVCQAINTVGGTVVNNNGMVCDNSTDDTSAFRTLLTAAGTNDTKFVFTSPLACRVANITTGKNITLDFSTGGSLSLISSTTSPGGAGFVNGTSVECGAGTTCATPALAVTAGNTLIADVMIYPGFTFATTSVSDSCGNAYAHVFQSLANQPRNQGMWVASNALAGNCITTAVANGSATTQQIIVQQFSGMGPIVSPDGIGASFNSTGTAMTSGSAATTAGSLLVACGGPDHFFSETVTAGAGFVQPAGLAGQTATGYLQCEYKLSSAGGAVTATATLSNDPSPATWVYSLVPLKVGNATLTMLGSVLDPDLHQIFFNADGATGHGVVDLTGNLNNSLVVFPEWWGGGSTATAANNVLALQGAIYAAFGCGPTQCRINGNGNNAYNKTLFLGQNFTINAELQLYHANGFKIACGNRLSTGITQAGTNLRIIDGQSTSYGAFYDCAWAGSASNTNALIDLDYTGAQGSDLRPQFIDFYNNTFSGSGLVANGVLLAKSGGGAQGSNINFYDPEFSGFTQAALQVGSAAAGAQNALAVGIFNGDFQGNPQYGFADYGGGFIQFYGTSFEDGGFNLVAQTGADIFCTAPQGPVTIYDVRSESRKFLWCDLAKILNSRNIDQAVTPVPGSTFPVSPYSVITGNRVTGDGAYYQVTANASGFSGAGTPAAPILASSGSATTLVDTNETVAGSRTIGIFTLSPTPDTVTQASTGATGTLLSSPTSTVTVAGVATGQFQFGETATQATTGVTGVVTTTTPPAGGPNLHFSSISGAADGTHTWTGGTSGATFAPSGVPTFSVSNPPMLITVHTGSPDNSHDWVGSISNAHYTPTATPTAAVNWTTNAFAGQLVGIWTGTNQNCYGTIASNTANSLTIGSWITKYPYTICSAPDITSTFIVEPAWSHAGTVTSGGMQMQYIAEDVIRGGASSTTPMQGRIEDSYFAGGQVRIAAGTNAAKTVVSNLIVTRPDWYDASTPGGPGTNDIDWDVRVLPYQGIVNSNWSLPAIGGTNYNGSLHRSLGSSAICWETGTINTNIPPANTSANEVCLGGRTDVSAGTSTSRNILEYVGVLGRATQLGTDLNGTSTDIQGGLPSGAGTPGAINFWTGNAGSTGTSITDGTKRWQILGTGMLVAFADNTYDIGAAGATRPRTGYFGTSVVTPQIATTAATLALATGAIGAHTCTSAQTVALAGATTSSVIKWSFASTPIGVTGYGDATTPFLVITTFATTNTANVVVCNTSAGSITPGAITLNLRLEL